MSSPDLPRANWRKSTRSEGSNACVEVLRTANIVALRDSKDPAGGSLLLIAPTWQAFVSGIKRGSFARADSPR